MHESTTAKPLTPFEVAIAIALYTYNVAPLTRAQRLLAHFAGQAVAELEDLVHWCMSGRVTDMPLPTGSAYVDHAIDSYGNEARIRASYLPKELAMMKAGGDDIVIVPIDLDKDGG